MRISDWSSDMCSSDLEELARLHEILQTLPPKCREAFELKKFQDFSQRRIAEHMGIAESTVEKHLAKALRLVSEAMKQAPAGAENGKRSEEHTSELQSLMRISYAVFCLKKKNKHSLEYNTYQRNNIISAACR